MDSKLRLAQRQAYQATDDTEKVWAYVRELERLSGVSYLQEEPCSAFITEESLVQNHGEVCVEGDWHCELPAKHGGLHHHTHTMQWNEEIEYPPLTD